MRVANVFASCGASDARTPTQNGDVSHLSLTLRGVGVSNFHRGNKMRSRYARRGFAASYLFIRGNWRSFAHHFVNIAVARRYARRIFANENEPRIRIESAGKDR